MRFLLSIVRTLPTLVIALIATYVFGLGTFAGTVAISIFTFGYVGKKLYEQIETVDMGAYEAIQALGASKLRAFFKCNYTTSFTIVYRHKFIFVLKVMLDMRAILGYVGAGGIGLILNENLSWREYGNVGMVLISLFMVVILIELLSHYLRKKLT